jgi:hypothetical protein
MTVCLLCGADVSEREAVRSCAACPMESTCRRVCCPRCGYEQPELSPLARWVGKVAGAVRAGATKARSHGRPPRNA